MPAQISSVSFQLFIISSIAIWLSAMVILLIVAIHKAQSPLIQEISRMLSISPVAPQPAVRTASDLQPAGTATPLNARLATSPPVPTLPQQISYQRKFSVLGGYLDRQQRMFTAIWELNDGYLLQTIRTKSSQIDYLKVSDHQLNLLAESTTAFAEDQGSSSRMLRGIGDSFDQRRATTVQLTIVGQHIVTGGLEPTPHLTSEVTAQTRPMYQPFQEVFTMLSNIKSEL